MRVSYIFPVRPLLVPANVQLLLTPLDVRRRWLCVYSGAQAVRAAVGHAIQGHQRLHGRNVDQHRQVPAGIKHTSHLHLV